MSWSITVKPIRALRHSILSESVDIFAFIIHDGEEIAVENGYWQHVDALYEKHPMEVV